MPSRQRPACQGGASLWHRSDILGQFLVEATILSLVGGIAGVVLGSDGASTVEHYAHLGVVLNGRLTFVAMGFAAAVGIFFGLQPAWKASLLQPVDPCSDEVRHLKRFRFPMAGLV